MKNNKKTLSVAVIAILLIAGIFSYYFGLYKPKKALQTSQETEKLLILTIASRYYNYAFGDDETVFKKCQSMKVSNIKEGKLAGGFTIEEILRHDNACKCAVVSVKRAMVKFIADYYEKAMKGVNDEDSFRKGTANFKEHSDLFIESALEFCKLEQDFKLMDNLKNQSENGE